jgi:hypothetical protein
MKTETNVAVKIEQLLDRVAKLTTADKLKPTRFNARGEQHARRVAQADQVEDSSTSGNHR